MTYTSLTATVMIVMLVGVGWGVRELLQAVNFIAKCVAGLGADEVEDEEDTGDHPVGFHTARKED